MTHLAEMEVLPGRGGTKPSSPTTHSGVRTRVVRSALNTHAVAALACSAAGINFKHASIAQKSRGGKGKKM